MCSLRLVAGLTLLGVVAAVADANAVPSFSRQTGMTCNQCHVSFGGPVPNFTFTGKKFRMNGYRMPFVGEKIEAGEPGRVHGSRLNMPLVPYLSLRYQSVFAQQSKRAGIDATTGKEFEKSKVSSNPTSRLALFPAGAVGDHIGLWVELYLTPDGAPNADWTFGLFSFDEYDLRFVKISENYTVGFAFNNQSIREISGFGPWPVGIEGVLTRGGFAGWSHPNRGAMYVYGWFNDQIFATAGASPGEDNLVWDKRNYQAQLAWAPLHSDANELWLNVMTQFGNDGIPFVTRTSPRSDRTWAYSDAVSGISATRGKDAGGKAMGAYLSSDLGDYNRLEAEVRYGFIDRGPHSIETVGRLIRARETYADNAEAEFDALAGAVRYVYDRTWGLDFVLQKDLNRKFIDKKAVEHEINSDLVWNTWLSYRPAMNFLVTFNIANSQTLRLDGETLPHGWSWSLAVDYLF